MISVVSELKLHAVNITSFTQQFVYISTCVGRRFTARRTTRGDSAVYVLCRAAVQSVLQWTYHRCTEDGLSDLISDARIQE